MELSRDLEIIALQERELQFRSLSKMLSGLNVSEISDIQEDEPEAPVSGWSQGNDVTLRRKQLNGVFAYHT